MDGGLAMNHMQKEAMKAGLNVAREALADKYEKHLHDLLIFHAGESVVHAVKGDAEKEKAHEDFANTIMSMQKDFGVRK